MTESTRIVFSAEEIDRRVRELADRISKEYAGRELMCLVVLKGGFFFAADLIRHLKGVDIQLEFVKLQSYAGTRSTGHVDFRGHMPNVAGYDLLVIEDLVDTGLTLASLHEVLLAQGPRSLRYAVAVDKKARREIRFDCEYVAFDVDEDLFLVGYGMDHDGRMRTEPDILELKG